jgi:hypothetical protein
LQEAIPKGTAQLNAVLYFDGIQQDATGFVSVDGGIVQGAFFRRAAREQNEAMRSICSFSEVRGTIACLLVCHDLHFPVVVIVGVGHANFFAPVWYMHLLLLFVLLLGVMM